MIVFIHEVIFPMKPTIYNQQHETNRNYLNKNTKTKN